MRTVYFIQAGEAGPVKIGTTRDPQKRLRMLQCAHPDVLELRLAVPEADEVLFHQRFSHLRIRGEWFRFEGTLRAFLRSPEPTAEVGDFASQRPACERYLLGVIKGLGAKQKDLAWAAGISESRLSRIVNGRVRVGKMGLPEVESLLAALRQMTGRRRGLTLNDLVDERGAA